MIYRCPDRPEISLSFFNGSKLSLYISLNATDWYEADLLAIAQNIPIDTAEQRVRIQPAKSTIQYGQLPTV